MHAFRDGPVPVPADHGSTADAQPLRAWEMLMREGVAAARGGRFGAAEDLYQRALELARGLLYLDAPGGGHEDDRVAAFVVSRLNLADLYRDADRTDAAVAHLCAAHRTLMALLRNGQTPQALRQAAFRHSRETHAALLAHVAEYGGHPDIEAAVRAGCMPLAAQPPLAGLQGATLH